MPKIESGARASSHFQPMKTTGTHHLIERIYRESGTFQWVRETVINALEAGATRIEFGIDWQAVESKNVYRRIIADNGKGMTAEELVAFFNTFGGGGKPIGDVHENFGVGAKTSILPWNRYGMVVISWVDGIPAMIWVYQDPTTEEYGLRIEEVRDGDGNSLLESVCEPYEDEFHGCDWSKIKPNWIDDNGTVIVLLGNSPDQNTVQGNPTRANESDTKGISNFLNRRLWWIPENFEITVDELRHQDKSNWPADKKMAFTIPAGGQLDRRINRRKILGAKYFVNYPRPDITDGKLAASGTVHLKDFTEIDWYLWDGDRPAVHMYAAKDGYIAALYRNELYDVTRHHSTYRMFGVSENQVRKRLWLIIRPMELDSGGFGVYPRTDRNALLLKGGPNAGGNLPIVDWAAEFADAMPQEIIDAISAARGDEDGTIQNETWRQRLAERFGLRWRIAKLRIQPGGSATVIPIQAGTKAHKRAVKSKTRSNRGGTDGTGGTGGNQTLGRSAGAKPAVNTHVAGGIPSFRYAPKDDFSDGVLAAWQPHDPKYPEGVVLINKDHPVILDEIEHWQAQFADHHAEAIRKDVMDTYGEIAVAKVAHSEHLRGIIPSDIVDSELRSDYALTMALLGLIAEETLIGQRVYRKYRRKTLAA